MAHTSVTGRKVKCDATVLSVGSLNVLAIADDCTLTVEREAVEVPAALDEWTYREQCKADWNFQIGTLRVAGLSFLTLIVTGGLVVVSANTDGLETFYGVGFMTGYTKNLDSPQKQLLTIVGHGLTPTVT